MAGAFVDLVLWPKFLRSRECPLGLAGGMGAKAGSVAGAAHVAQDEVLVRKAEVEFGLKVGMVEEAFAETIAKKHDVFAFLWLGGRSCRENCGEGEEECGEVGSGGHARCYNYKSEGGSLSMNGPLAKGKGAVRGTGRSSLGALRACLPNFDR